MAAIVSFYIITWHHIHSSNMSIEYYTMIVTGNACGQTITPEEIAFRRHGRNQNFIIALNG